ncbi:MAG: porin family protein [Pseudomonadales bacterium]|nr:porin family protein [Pseudomonadales bacterium]
MNKVLLGIIISAAAAYSTANDLETDQRGWIVGGGVGAANLSIKPKDQPDLLSDTESVMLFTVYGGYNFTDWFGIEFDISTSQTFTDVNTQLDASILGTSFTPKFTYHFNQNIGIYFKTGLQYIAYSQSIDAYYDDDITWNGIEPFIGAGLQYSFTSGVRARIDYKYSKLSLERSENATYGFKLFDEEIDLTFNAITFSTHYQF